MYIALIFEWNTEEKEIDEQMLAQTISGILKNGLRKEVEKKKLKNSNAFKAIIFIIVMLIPLIYSFFYLKSYWNPYGNLSDMQIAVVNLDKGKDDKNQGNEFVQSLKDSDTFKICEVSKDEAQEGMKKGNYYATIEIPENFTECLESASTEDKQIAQVTYSPNQATNYLATQIVNSAVKTIELNLQSKIDKEKYSKFSKQIKRSSR